MIFLSLNFFWYSFDVILISLLVSVELEQLVMSNFGYRKNEEFAFLEILLG